MIKLNSYYALELTRTIRPSMGILRELFSGRWLCFAEEKILRWLSILSVDIIYLTLFMFLNLCAKMYS